MTLIRPSAGLPYAKANAVLFYLCQVMGISDAELAEATGVSRQTTYNRRAKGASIPTSALPEIAEALGVGVDLFYGEPIDAVRWVVSARPELFGATPSDNEPAGSPAHYSAQNRCIAHSHRQVTRFNRRPLTLGNLTRSRRTGNSVTLNLNQLGVSLLRSGRRDTK